MIPNEDIRRRLSADDECVVIDELSPEVQTLLSYEGTLAEAINSLLAGSEVIAKGLCADIMTVFCVSDKIIVKVAINESATTESRTLMYLKEYLTDFPAPEPHGLVRSGRHYLLFTAYMGPRKLEEVWLELDQGQKVSISTHLDGLLTQLRSLPRPDDIPFGEIGGGGCKDTRRGTRISKNAITTTSQFSDFVFSGAAYTTPSYIQFLRSFTSHSPPQCVFTHGDFYPRNIIVDQAEDGSWQVVGIVDWENSGFYPAYWEGVKMTNCLAPSDGSDWYLHLPESAAPWRYAVEWLVDRLLERKSWHT